MRGDGAAEHSLRERFVAVVDASGRGDGRHDRGVGGGVREGRDVQHHRARNERSEDHEEAVARIGAGSFDVARRGRCGGRRQRRESARLLPAGLQRDRETAAEPAEAGLERAAAPAYRARPDGEEEGGDGGEERADDAQFVSEGWVSRGEVRSRGRRRAAPRGSGRTADAAVASAGERGGGSEQSGPEVHARRACAALVAHGVGAPDVRDPGPRRSHAAAPLLLPRGLRSGPRGQQEGHARPQVGAERHRGDLPPSLPAGAHGHRDHHAQPLLLPQFPRGGRVSPGLPGHDGAKTAVPAVAPAVPASVPAGAAGGEGGVDAAVADAAAVELRVSDASEHGGGAIVQRHPAIPGVPVGYCGLHIGDAGPGQAGGVPRSVEADRRAERGAAGGLHGAVQRDGGGRRDPSLHVRVALLQRGHRAELPRAAGALRGARRAAAGRALRLGGPSVPQHRRGLDARADEHGRREGADARVLLLPALPAEQQRAGSGHAAGRNEAGRRDSAALGEVAGGVRADQHAGVGVGLRERAAERLDRSDFRIQAARPGGREGLQRLLLHDVRGHGGPARAHRSGGAQSRRVADRQLRPDALAALHHAAPQASVRRRGAGRARTQDPPGHGAEPAARLHAPHLAHHPPPLQPREPRRPLGRRRRLRGAAPLPRRAAGPQAASLHLPALRAARTPPSPPRRRFPRGPAQSRGAGTGESRGGVDAGADACAVLHGRVADAVVQHGPSRLRGVRAAAGRRGAPAEAAVQRRAGELHRADGGRERGAGGHARRIGGGMGAGVAMRRRSEAGRPSVILPGLPSKVVQICASKDLDLVVASTASNQVYLFNLRDGRFVQVIDCTQRVESPWQEEGKTVKANYRITQLLTTWMGYVVISMISVRRGLPNYLLCFDVNGILLYERHDVAKIHTLSASHDSKWLFAESTHHICIFTLPDLRLNTVLASPKLKIESLCVSSDNRALLAGVENGDVFCYGLNLRWKEKEDEMPVEAEEEMMEGNEELD
ncbi:uncharacterized protein [Blastocystis hominis]|uniref:Uncharacterized protein n=1 Tax=Blastocystis hominis TaxID=12968 RepID=D8MA52_BLAHO|nr:uncharacterized protein [Blastocystis hominis]CBK24941.2 unnamed protein product [Blastocystis hominis]|eukprot:XP_012898989.1 uncharacterized protein [Blastocystis hominis]